MTSEPIAEYFEALERLKKRRERVNNDTVAIEAGRKKGSIKKSRPVFADLIVAINAAAADQTKPKDEQQERLTKIKLAAGDLREQLDASRAREISLLAELYEVRKQLAKLTGGKVIPIRGASRASQDEVHPA